VPEDCTKDAKTCVGHSSFSLTDISEPLKKKEIRRSITKSVKTGGGLLSGYYPKSAGHLTLSSGGEDKDKDKEKEKTTKKNEDKSKPNDSATGKKDKKQGQSGELSKSKRTGRFKL